MTQARAPGAHHEIKVDGVGRTHRDERGAAHRGRALPATAQSEAKVTVTEAAKIVVTDLRDGSDVSFERG